MGRVGRFILKVAAVLILIVSAGTFALSLFTGETRNGDNLQSEFDYLITVGISQSGEESSWKDANTASFMDTFVKSNGYEAVYADAGSDQEKQIEDVEGFIKQGVDYIILNPISEIGCNIVISVAVLDDKGGTAPDPLWRWILPAYKKLSVQPVIYRCQIKEILHDLVM